MATTYFLISWVDHHAHDKAQRLTRREYGTASSKQAAIRFAEHVLPQAPSTSSPPCTAPSTRAARQTSTGAADEGRIGARLVQA